jgi:hypothetical protein
VYPPVRAASPFLLPHKSLSHFRRIPESSCDDDDDDDSPQ